MWLYLYKISKNANVELALSHISQLQLDLLLCYYFRYALHVNYSAISYWQKTIRCQ